MSTYALTNANTGEVEQTFDSIDPAEIPGIIDAADTAYKEWHKKPVSERAGVLTKAAAIFRERNAELAEIIGKEMGKPVNDAKGEIELVANIFEWYADHAAELLEDEKLDAKGAPTNLVRHESMGVLIGVMPWNFPYYQLARFAAPNLLLGNTILMKQASICPVSSAKFEEILFDAGLVKHAYQNLYLNTEDVETILEDLRVKGASVTGSERAGTAVAMAAAKNVKKSVMELGGNDPAIVLDSVNDVAKVAKRLTFMRYANAGQVCASPKRVIVLESIYDEFVKASVEAAKKVKVGDASDTSTTMGPLSSESARDETVERIAQAVKDGATLHFGGEKLDRPGWFMSPAVLTDVAFDADLSCNELFGPAMVIYKVKSEEEAIKFANNSEYGLQASVWTDDVEHGFEVADQLVTGMAFVNEHITTQEDLPFGGVNKSGYGRELTQWGFYEFSNEKLIRGGAIDR